MKAPILKAKRCSQTRSALALLVVLDTLTPAERLAFVLHDLFAIPFDDGPIIGPFSRRSQAARQPGASAGTRLANPIGCPPKSSAGSRGGVLRAVRAGDSGPDRGAGSRRRPAHRCRFTLRRRRSHRCPGIGSRYGARNQGASTWAAQLIALSRGMRFVQPALINGSVGLIFAPRGKLARVLTFTFTDDKVARLEVIGDPASFPSSISRSSSPPADPATTFCYRRLVTMESIHPWKSSSCSSGSTRRSVTPARWSTV